jgi:hypothetical protein
VELYDLDLEHRRLRSVESIGVDEIHWGRGLRADNFVQALSTGTAEHFGSLVGGMLTEFLLAG